VIEKERSTATSWVPNLVALLVDTTAAKMVEESLDCLMVPGTKWVISMEHWLAFLMVASLDFLMAAG